MGTPTLIRHAEVDDYIVTVTTVLTRGVHTSYVQTYLANGINDELFLEDSTVWLDETEAKVAWAKIVEELGGVTCQ